MGLCLFRDFEVGVAGPVLDLSDSGAGCLFAGLDVHE